MSSDKKNLIYFLHDEEASQDTSSDELFDSKGSENQILQS